MYQQTTGYTNSYTNNQKEGLSQVELECRAFICSASAMNRIKEHWEEEKKNLPDVLEKNRLLWTVIASAMKEDDCPQPQSVRNNMLQLSMFVFKRTLELLGEPRPEGLDVLININLNIARGLSGKATD